MPKYILTKLHKTKSIKNLTRSHDKKAKLMIIKRLELLLVHKQLVITIKEASKKVLSQIS
jgi:hypothetical protein